MVGGVLEIVGLVALLIGLCEFVARAFAGRSTRAELQRQRDVLSGYPPSGELCAWPRLEPEHEQLRRKGAL